MENYYFLKRVLAMGQYLAIAGFVAIAMVDFFLGGNDWKMLASGALVRVVWKIL